VAYNRAREFDPLSRFYNASVLDMSFDTNVYDAIYCFNVLHLFRENDRYVFIQQCDNKLNKGGLMFFTVFSEKESSFGEGREVERNTFESRPGRPAHYFTEADLKAHFVKLG
jgi:chemotaxis methyl-accepting protein methylase